MHAWTMVTDTPVWRGIARAKTGKDRRRAGGQMGQPSGLRACAQGRWAWRMMTDSGG